MKPFDLSLIRKLLLPPTCAGCGERLIPISKNSATYHKVCFCSSCLEKWHLLRAELCKKCGKDALHCECISPFLRNLQPELPALCFYHAGVTEVSDRVIINLKQHYNEELFSYISLELLPLIVSALNKIGVEGEDCIFTWIPRTRKNIAKFGFDQGKELCCQIAAGFGQKPYYLLDRIGGREQKKLDKSRRSKNVNHTIILNTSAKRKSKCESVENLSDTVKGKTVVVIDDVITSGSTVRRAVELLQGAGADRVFVACVAKTKPKGKTK